MEDEYKVMMPVVEVEARYLKPAKYDDELIIRSIMEELPTRMVQFKHEIYNHEMSLLHKASVKLFFIDMETFENKLSEDLQNLLKPWF